MNVALVSFVRLDSKDFKRNDPKRDCFWDIPELFDPPRKCWTLNSGCWTLDAGLWTLDSGRWTLNAGLWTLDF